MHKMTIFRICPEGNMNYGKIAGVDYAEVYWQHLGGVFRWNR